MEKLLELISIGVYGVLGLIALWGAFCVFLIWRRVAHIRFRDERQQTDFLGAIDQRLHSGDVTTAIEYCSGDPRAMPQLVELALANRDQGFKRVRQLVVDRFERDVLADLEHRLSWIHTVIKGAPMVGLLGTVIGMMGAFTKLSSGAKVDTTRLAEDISFALVTTACGLAIAIPLVFCAASLNVRIRKMEELVGSGLTHFMESFKTMLRTSSRGGDDG